MNRSSLSKSFGVVIFLIFILCVAETQADEPTLVIGEVGHVRDGDTIEVGGIPIRLNGVSAPEMDEALSLQSKAFMAQLVLGRRVRCELDGAKTYDRWVGVCFLDGKDIGQAIIESGLALDCPRYSNRRYAEYEENDARNNIALPKYCR